MAQIPNTPILKFGRWFFGGLAVLGLLLVLLAFLFHNADNADRWLSAGLTCLLVGGATFGLTFVTGIFPDKPKP